MIEQTSTANAARENGRAIAPAETGNRGHKRDAGLIRDPFAAFASQWRSGGNTVLGVCGCERGCGGTYVAASIAISSASVLDRRTLLVDANLYHPSLHRSFRIEANPGLADALAMRVEPDDCIQVSRVPRLSVLTAGSINFARWSDFNIERLGSLLTELQNDFDLIVVDLPSAHDMADGIRLAAAPDEVILVVESERTSAKVARQSHHRLVQSGANVTGTVLNKTRVYVPEWLDRWL